MYLKMKLLQNLEMFSAKPVKNTFDSVHSLVNLQTRRLLCTYFLKIFTTFQQQMFYGTCLNDYLCFITTKTDLSDKYQVQCYQVQRGYWYVPPHFETLFFVISLLVKQIRVNHVTKKQSRNICRKLKHEKPGNSGLIIF